MFSRRKVFILAFVSVFILTTMRVIGQDAGVVKNFAKVPLSFTGNNGRLNSDVKFTTHGNGVSMYFTRGGTTFLLSRPVENALRKASSDGTRTPYEDHMENEIDYEYFSLNLLFIGANQDPVITGEDRLPWYTNYIMGKNPSDWVTNVPNYEKIQLKDIYDGIDLVYYGDQKNIKYDFILQPGADPDKIQIKYDLGGYNSGVLEIDENNELHVKTPFGDIIEKKPVAYQIVGGNKVFVDIVYRIIDNNENIYSFTLGEYDRSETVIIDPVIVYSSYLGMSGLESLSDIEVDDSGFIYISGHSTSSDLPTTAGAYDETHNTGRDFFVCKLNPAGDQIVFLTYIGGSGDDTLRDTEIDASGNIYMTGFSNSSDFPTTAGAFNETINGGIDCIAAKLNSTGTSLLYSTYLGGSGTDRAFRIVEKNDYIYLTGYTNSSNYPTTSGAYLESNAGGYDGFFTKINTDGTDIIFSSYYGGSSDEYSYDIRLDSAGNMYLTGHTRSSNFPTSADAYDTSKEGTNDAYLIKFHYNAGSLLYSTYFGGNSYDYPYRLDFDSNMNVFVTGSTQSTNFPVTAGAFQTVKSNSNHSGFVIKFTTACTSLVYSTYISGSDHDQMYNMLVDSTGRAIVCGETMSTDYPVSADAPYPNASNTGDGVISILSADGSDLDYSTYFPGNDYEVFTSLELKGTSDLYYGGSSKSGDFPVTANAYDNTYSSDYDAVFGKIVLDSVFVVSNYTPVLAPIGNKQIKERDSLTIVLSATDIEGDSITYSASNLPAGATFTDSTFNWHTDTGDAGVYNVTFYAADSVSADSETVQITVVINTPPVFAPIGNKEVTENDSLVFGLYATDADGDSIYFTAANMPMGATLIDTLFRWIPDTDDAGVYNVTFYANDLSDIDSQTIQITVNDLVAANNAPVLESISNQPVIEGDIFTITMHATDADGDPLTYSVYNNPAGSYLYQDSIFIWNPKVGDLTGYEYQDVIFRVSDGTDSVSTTVRLYESETMSDSAATYQKNDLTGFTGIEGGSVLRFNPATFSVADTFDWGVGNDVSFSVLKYSDILIPNDAVIDSARLIFTKAYDDHLTDDDYALIASSLKKVDIGDFNWDHYDYSASSAWSTGGAKGADTDYSTASRDSVKLVYDVNEPYFVFDVTGLVSASYGVDSVRPDYGWIIRGNPDVHNRFVLQGINKNFESPKLRVYYTLAAVTNNPPVLTPIGNKEITEKETLNFTLSATDADGDSITFSASNMPSGATLTDSVFNWVTDTADAGVYNVTFYASDSAAADSEIVQITVNDFVNTAPVLEEISYQNNVDQGDIFAITLRATDADGDNITYSVSGNPPQSGIINDSLFYWYPKKDKSYNTQYSTTFTASDGDDTHSRQVFLNLNQSMSDSAVTFQKNDLTGFIGMEYGQVWNSPYYSISPDSVLFDADTFNWGGYENAFGAIKFWDLNIPENAAIDSAYLVLTLYPEEETFPGYSLSNPAYISKALKNIDISDFTWNDYDKSLSLQWTTPGAQSLGNDYSLDEADTTSITDDDSTTIFDVTKLVKASWGSDSSFVNYGWLIKGVNQITRESSYKYKGYSKNFESPKLRVYYSYTEPDKIVVAKDGNDATGDGSEANPYLTIGKAYAMASEGDSILVKEGYYSENLTISKNEITISGQKHDTVTVRSKLKIEGDNNIIENLLFKKNNCRIEITGNSNIIKDNFFLNAEYDISLLIRDVADSTIIDGNIFLNASYSSRYTVIKNYSSKNTVISHNTFYSDNNKPTTTAIYNKGLIIVKDNIFQNFKYAIRELEPTIIANNVFHNNETNFEGFESPSGNGNLFLDPKFAGKFHLLSTSPAIGAASDGGDIGAVDYDPTNPVEFTFNKYILNYRGFLEITQENNELYRGYEIGKTVNQTFFMKNTSTSSLQLSSIVLTNDNEFGVVSPETYPQTLSPGDSILVKVRFTPSERRLFYAPFKTDIILTTDNQNLNPVVLYAFGLGRIVYDPEIFPDSLKTGTVNTAYFDTLNVTNHNNYYALFFAKEEGPNWLTVTTKDTLCELSGTPLFGDEGTDIPVVISVRDSSGSHNDTLYTTINVLADTNFARKIVVAKDGSDATGDGSEANPYLTIGKAIDMASFNGDTILVKPGYYEEDLTIDKNNLVIRGVTSDSVRLITKAEITGTGVTFEGFTVMHRRFSLVEWPENHFVVSGSGSTVLNNVFFSILGKSNIRQNASGIIKNNVFINPQQSVYSNYAIDVYSDDVSILNNSFISEKYAGLNLYTIGIDFNSVSNCIVQNNILRDYWRALNAYSSTVSVSYNNLFNNTINYENITPGAGEIYTDPELVGKFYLDPSSSAIGAGAGGVDIGAFSYSITTNPGYSITKHFLTFKGEIKTYGMDFLGTTVGEPETQSLFIENISTSPLSLTEINVENSDVFEVISPVNFPHIINPDGSVEVRVRFSPDETRQNEYDFYSAIVHVTTNDPNQPVFDIYLVGNSNHYKPIFLEQDISDALEDSVYSDTVFIEPSDTTNTPDFEILTGPEWLTISRIDSASALLSGTPDNDDVADSILVVLRVSESVTGKADTMTAYLNVINTNDAPVITTAFADTAFTYVPYVDSVQVTDVDVGDTTFTFTLIDAPAWLSINDDGVKSGTPNETGVFDFDIRATDSGGLYDEEHVYLVVLSNRPIIHDTDILDAVEDVAYLDTIQVSYDYSDTLIYEIATGPEWLELSGNTDFGLLTGTPENDDVGDSIQVVIVVKDLENLSDTLETYFNVANVNDAPVITTVSFDTASEMVAFSQAIAVEEVDARDTLVFRLTGGPSWLSFDSTTGIISGTPAFGDDDTTMMTLTVTDLSGAADTLAGYFLTVPFISHYEYRKNTEDSYSIVVDTVEYADLELGDEIAVYDGSLVVGAAVYRGTFPMGLTAWEDDPQTQDKDGYKDGNDMTLVLYDASKQVESSTTPAYLVGDGEFGTGSYTQLTVTVAVHTVQPILLKQGWNLFSSYITPDDSDFETIMEDIAENAEIFKNDKGKFYIPGVIDKINDWDVEEAYMVYMTAPDTLNISGLIIPLSTPICLKKKWNYVPNYYTASTPVSTALASLGTDLEIVKNDEGDFYIPDVIDGIVNLLPGEGYKMYLASNTSLVYGASGHLLAKQSPVPSLSRAVSSGEFILSDAAVRDGEPGEPGDPGGISDGAKKTAVSYVVTDTFYNPPTNTDDSYSIVISDAQINGKTIQTGDEIAVFDVNTEGDTIIVGSMVFDGEFPADLAAWIDDSQTDGIDGYTAGNTMMFRIYDRSADIEYFASPTYSTGDGTFGNGFYSNISSLKTTGRYGQVIQSEENEENEVTVNSDSAKVILSFSNNNTVSVKFDSGNVSGATLTVTQMTTTTIADSVPSGQQFSKPVTYYNIDIGVADFTATLSFEYSDSVINALGISESDLGVSFYDSLDNRGYIWHVCGATVNTDDNIITVATRHFSIWAVVDKTEEIITSVEDENEFPVPDRLPRPEKVELMQNYPNPFNPVTTIKYQIPEPADVTLKIYNISGQLVRTLVSTRMPTGYHSVSWNGTNSFGARVGSGIYFYHLRAGRVSVVKKMVMIK